MVMRRPTSLSRRRLRPAMRVALRRPDRHVGRGGDLLERKAERVLEHDDARLVGAISARQRVQLAAQLGAVGLARRIRVRGGAPVLEQRLAGAGALAARDVTARVDRQAGAATSRTATRPETGRSDAQLAPAPPALHRARPPDRAADGRASFSTRGACRSQSTSRARAVAVFCSFHQNRIAQPCVDQWPFRPEGLLDLTAARCVAVASAGSSLGA